MRGVERTALQPLTPQTIYSHITIKYCVLIKQFITQMVFVKCHQRVTEQTNEVLEFMRCRPTDQDQYKDNQNDYDNIYQKILLAHITDNSTEIWDKIFAEHNIDVVFRYLVDLIYHLSVYSDNTVTTDPKYTYSQETIRKHFYVNTKHHDFSRYIYLPETYLEFVRRIQPPCQPSYTEYKCAEHDKEIRNSILNDVFELIISTTQIHTTTTEPLTAFNMNPFYVYLEHYAKRLKKHDGTHIFDKNGNLEITESLIDKYTQALTTTTTWREMYTIWLLDMWCKI